MPPRDVPGHIGIDEDFSKKLLNAESLSRLLESFVSSAENYIFIVERSPIDWRVSQLRDRTLVLQNPPADHLASMAELASAKTVYAILRFADGGLARYNLTARECDTWIPSVQLSHSLSIFRDGLKQEGRAPICTPSGAFLVLVAPIALAVSISFLSDVWQHRPRSSGPIYYTGPVDEVFSVAQTISNFLIPCGAVLALLLIAFRRTGGGLRRWPEVVTSRGLLSAISRVRFSPISRGAVRSIIAPVIASVLTAVVCYLIFGKS